MIVLLVVWLGVLGAQAAPLAVPGGWAAGAAAGEPARERARAWAAAWGGEVREVMSTRAQDDFVETLAVVDVPTPMPVEALDDRSLARTWVTERVTAALGPAQLDTLELIPGDAPGVVVLHARVVMDDRAARLAFAPTGARHQVVVLLVPTAEEVLYTHAFEDTVDHLGGLLPPVAPFARALARGVALLLWLGAGTIIGVLWTRYSLPYPGARVAGRQVAGILAGCAVLVMLLARLGLGGSSLALALAGTSPWALAFEIGIGGVVMAGLVLVATELWERRLRPVASAPTAGSFSISGIHARRTRTDPASRPSAGSLGSRPAVTGDTQVGPPPAVTGDTQVGPPPAVTGDTQVGPPPAVTGNTKVGPPPAPLDEDQLESGPPVREVISGDFEVTNTSRSPAPSRPKPPTHDTAWLDHLGDDLVLQPRTGGSGSSRIPERRPSSSDSHPALDAPLPPRRR